MCGSRIYSIYSNCPTTPISVVFFLFRLVLACHFDSKYSNDDSFIGATDSAVPCAMLLHMASSMQSMLTQHKNSPHNVTLQFLFFDGEEAFQFWTSSDSLYGSRHLAAKWDKTPYPPNNGDGTTLLHRMVIKMNIKRIRITYDSWKCDVICINNDYDRGW